MAIGSVGAVDGDLFSALGLRGEPNAKLFKRELKVERVLMPKALRNDWNKRNSSLHISLHLVLRSPMHWGL